MVRIVINESIESRELIHKRNIVVQTLQQGQTTARAVGGYSERVHLFPFRTEKLSRSALMVLPLGGRVGRCQLNTTL
jgi:hypothetical protein